MKTTLKQKNQFLYETKCMLMMLCAALISSFSLHVFVIPSCFSPSGIDGISTILYELTGINTGWFKLIINLPLMLLAWIFLKKRYVLYVCLFTVLDSIGLILLAKTNFYIFLPLGLSAGEALGYRIISAVYAGIALGICTGLMLKIGCSTGGIDIAANLINLKHPNLNTEKIISVICYGVILLSYFIYRDLTSVLLSLIQIFVFEWTTASMLHRERYATEIKIITKSPDVIREKLSCCYGQNAAALKAEGMLPGEEFYLMITVLHRKKAMNFIQDIQQYPDTFLYFSENTRIQGSVYPCGTSSKNIQMFQ